MVSHDVREERRSKRCSLLEHGRDVGSVLNKRERYVFGRRHADEMNATSAKIVNFLSLRQTTEADRFLSIRTSRDALTVQVMGSHEVKHR